MFCLACCGMCLLYVCAYMPTLFIIAMVGIFARQYEANCLVFLCVLQMFFLAMVCILVKLEILTERFRRQLIEQYWHEQLSEPNEYYSKYLGKGE